MSYMNRWNKRSRTARSEVVRICQPLLTVATHVKCEINSPAADVDEVGGIMHYSLCVFFFFFAFLCISSFFSYSPRSTFTFMLTCEL